MGHPPVFAEVAVELPSVVPGQNGKVDLALSSVSAHLQNRQMSSMITVPISVTYLKIVKLCLLG